MLALWGGGGGIGGDGGADKIFAVFFDGVLLGQKTHGLLLASVPGSRHSELAARCQQVRANNPVALLGHR